MTCVTTNYISDLGHIGCGGTLVAFDNVKFHPGTLIEGLVPFGIDGSVMNEDIATTIVLLNKTKSF